MKKIILLLCIFFLTGCTQEVNFEFKNNEVNSNLKISVTDIEYQNSDYYDDNTINHSYLAPYLVKYVNEQGKTNDAYINAEHCQFAWYDKNSQDDFIKTMRTQYPKSSNDEIIKIIESGFGTNRINLKR